MRLSSIPSLSSTSWTASQRSTLEKMRTHSIELSARYQQEFWAWRAQSVGGKLVGAALASIGTCLSLSNSGYVSPDATKWVSLGVGVISGIAGLVQIALAARQVDDRLAASHTAHAGFLALSRDLTVWLSVPPEDPSDTIVHECHRRFQALLADAPILPLPPLVFSDEGGASLPSEEED
jgi:hypothetical protein